MDRDTQHSRTMEPTPQSVSLPARALRAPAYLVLHEAQEHSTVSQAKKYKKMVRLEFSSRDIST